MIKIDEKDIKYSRVLTCRYTLLKLIDQCNGYIYNNEPAIYMSKDLINFCDWLTLRKDIEKLLLYYDNGGEINEDFCISLYDIKITNNPILVKRLIKLIKIHL